MPRLIQRVTPQVAYCKDCKAILYDGHEIESPLEIIRIFAGVCPECGRKLTYDPDSMKFTPISKFDNDRDYQRFIKKRNDELGLKSRF
jgi:RNase P subunit RPR2